MRALRLLLLAAFTAALALPQSSAFDKSSLDPTCKPCNDFWRYTNGGWLDKNPIPDRYPSWGTLSVITEGNRERLRTILESAAKSNALAGSAERKIGDLYASCMDTAAIDARGITPLQHDLARIAAVQTVPQLASLLASLQRTSNIAPVALRGGQDLKNSKDVIIQIGGGGLSLPDRDYYFKDDARSKEIREKLLLQIAKMLVLLGDTPDAAAASAKTILAFETELAGATMTNVQRRDPYSHYHKMDFAGLAALTPAFDWKPVYAQFNLSESTPVNVGEPDYLKKFNTQLSAVPVADWKTWLRWRLIDAAAPSLSKPFVDQDFAFLTVLTGVKEQQPRWQTCVATVDRNLGEALGEVFVQKHFPPEAKRRMNELVENLRATLREELSNATWLEPATRQAAVAKLNAFVAKIGYPDKFRDYGKVAIDPSKYYENLRTASLNERLYRLAKIGQPVDRNEWGMTPPTVNAYYSPPMNEIAFPAGILQPPMFDMQADDAMNYGAIGAVIGHEMGHGFDDQGSKFDAEGNLKNWWTAADIEKFNARRDCVIDQFNTMNVADGLHHNGKLVVGEALGDLGGLTLAYKAWQRSLKGKPAPPAIDGFTPEQRFFLAFARVWGTKYRPEATRLQLNTNPHPLGEFRAIGTLQNMPEFHKAFSCKQGDPMVRPSDKQCKLW